MFSPKPLLKIYASFLFVIFLAACSQNTLAVKDSLQASIQGAQDVSLTPEQVEAIPYASIYARKKDGPQAFLVLAYAEQQGSQGFQLKWLSAQSEMLVTEHGRIVKTHGFIEGNLHKSYAIDADPLALGLLNANTPKQWQRFTDWQPGNYSHITLNSSFSIGDETQIEINGLAVNARHVIEEVSVLELNINYQNQFWLDPKTQQVIASVQRPAPLLDEIEIHILKPFSS